MIKASFCGSSRFFPKKNEEVNRTELSQVQIKHMLQTKWKL